MISDRAGRVALVTGAARGIGASIASTLIAEGYRVVAVDSCAGDQGVDPELGYTLGTSDELHAVVAGSGAGAGVAVVCDVRDAAGLGRAVGVAGERFGGLDVVVAAAGVHGGGASAWETSDGVWRHLFEVNVGGVVRLASVAIPELLRRPSPRSGRFVVVGSVASLVGLPGLAAYSASKSALGGLVRSMAAELGTEQVTVNGVCPGSTRTTMLEASARLYDLASPEDFSVHHLSGRLLEPAEVAAAVSWVCSPAASGITGTMLPVDAGFTAR